jgi:DinB superfamily
MTANALFVKMIFDRWNALLKNCDTLLDSLSDEQLLADVAPGKNRGIYLLGHLIAVHDDMMPLLGLGEKEHTALFEVFVKSADKAVEPIPAAAELRLLWKKQLESLNQKLATISADAWFEKHTAVSAEDFTKEPNRNKLNVIITRTTHLSYHLGQLALLK